MAKTRDKVNLSLSSYGWYELKLIRSGQTSYSNMIGRGSDFFQILEGFGKYHKNCVQEEFSLGSVSSVSPADGRGGFHSGLVELDLHVECTLPEPQRAVLEHMVLMHNYVAKYVAMARREKSVTRT